MFLPGTVLNRYWSRYKRCPQCSNALGISGSQRRVTIKSCKGCKASEFLGPFDEHYHRVCPACEIEWIVLYSKATHAEMRRQLDREEADRHKETK